MNEETRFIKGSVSFYKADSLKLAEIYPNNHFDLLIADPPYGIGMSKPAGLSQKYSKKKLNDKRWDDQAISKEFFMELFRISKNQIVFGANHFIDQLPEPRNSPSWIVWDKREGFIPERTYADCELAWTSFTGPTRIFRHYWDGFLQRTPERRIHPTQKPVSIYEWILMKYARPDDYILDPFGGSMSSAIASHNLDYKMTIIEKDEEIFEKGLERFKQITAQLKLF